MFRASLITFLCAAVLSCGALGRPGKAEADVVVPENLEVGSLKFPDGSTQSSASGVTKAWSGVVTTTQPGMAGIPPYQYVVSRTTTGDVTLFFPHEVPLCVVSAQAGTTSCFVASQSSNATRVQCTKHSDNTLVDATFAFICLAP
jgi:hypothetical protein